MWNELKWKGKMLEKNILKDQNKGMKNSQIFLSKNGSALPWLFRLLCVCVCVLICGFKFIFFNGRYDFAYILFVVAFLFFFLLLIACDELEKRDPRSVCVFFLISLRGHRIICHWFARESRSSLRWHLISSSLHSNSHLILFLNNQ